MKKETIGAVVGGAGWLLIFGIRCVTAGVPLYAAGGAVGGFIIFALIGAIIGRIWDKLEKKIKRS